MTDRPETAVRFVNKDEGIISGLIVPYNGPLPDNKDLLGTRFDAKTDLALDWFPDGGRPGLYSHGFDDELQTEVIGREVRSWEDDKGRWLEAQLDKAHRYAGEIMELVDRGALALSSAAVDHLVKIDRATRHVDRWPWVEWSLVPNPGNPEALIYHVRSTDAIKRTPEVAIRIVEDLDALIPEPEEPAPETTPEPVNADDVTASIRSMLTTLQPSNLHDLAVEMGATCPPDVPEVTEPGPTISIRADAADPAPLTDEDLQALRSSMQDVAISTVKELLK